MNILVACEFSGVVRDAFRARGHRVMSCDFRPTERLGPHWQGNVLEILDEPWDMLLAFPDCTYLTNSGVRFLHEPDQSEGPLKGLPRWIALWEAAAFFRLLLNCKIKKKCIENPIMHGYGAGLVRQKYSQIIHPWQHGHPENKSTCLWLEDLEDLEETDNVRGQMAHLTEKEKNKIHWEGKGPDRARNRSRTFPGIANAMAEKWG